MIKSFVLSFLLGLLATLPAQAQQACSQVFANKAAFPAPQVAAESAARAPGVRFDRAEVFDKIAQKVEQNRAELIKILSAVDNFHGAEYEITQVIRTLKGVRFHELAELNKAQNIQNVAVYGSTNIPLYTLILHGVLPASTGAHVWFRTPQLSREVYVQLFAHLAKVMPELPLSQIHILTEAKDVQYDNFRKMHVLGLNQKGKRFERPPSEVVIFTGNPQTGKEILEANRVKLEALSNLATEQNIPLKQIFLKFGSGLNPVIVTQQAAGRLQPALDAAITAVKINSSQDCIAPKLYAVHSSVRNDYFKGLQERLQGLKFGKNDDANADYGPLTFTQDFTQLKEFRQKWESYLVNKEAHLDETGKRVDPHVFVFPISMIKQVELLDHFAPFMIHFEYNSKSELSTLANDPRIRERAMFASIFGQASSTDLVQVRKLFEDGFHATVMNQSVFVEESGNFPFGGYSGDASSVTLLTRGEQGLREYTYNRPLLYSKEVSVFFGGPRGPPVQPKESSSTSQEQSRQIVQDLIADSARIDGLSTDWKNLTNPVQTLRPRGLKVLRQIIAQEGLFIVTDANAPQTHEAKIQNEKFYGPNVIYTSGGNQNFTPNKGVVLHPSFIDGEVRILNKARGRANPNLGFGFLHPKLFASKVSEYHVANAVRPGSMAKSSDFKTLMQTASHGPVVEGQRLKVAMEVDKVLQQGQKLSEAQETQLVNQIDYLLQSFFFAVHTQMPEGAFIKNFNETTTGDLGNQITSFSQNTKNYAREFVARLNSSLYGDRSSLKDQKAIERLNSAHYETGSKFITKLLTKPADLLIQQRLRLAKTDLGFPMEIRVDFLDGEAVHARPRYTHEYLRPEMAEAMRYLNEFFKEAPERLRLLSGGADLAKLEDGRWVFIEFNFGNNSGTVLAELFPIERNLYLSKLQGQMTPLIQELEIAFRGGTSTQNKYLKSLTVETELWQKKNIRDLSIAEVARYFRDRGLDEFRKSPTKENGDKLLSSLNQAFQGVGSESNRDLPLLIRGVENFLTRSLMSSTSRN